MAEAHAIFMLPPGPAPLAGRAGAWYRAPAWGVRASCYAGWRLIETRDASDNTLGQLQLGTHSRGRLCHMIDEPITRVGWASPPVNHTDVTFGGSADDDCLDAGFRMRIADRCPKTQWRG